jgi:hypothetical protein
MKQSDSPRVERRRGCRRAPSGLKKRYETVDKYASEAVQMNVWLLIRITCVSGALPSGVCKDESAHQPGSSRGHGRFPSDVGRLMLHRLQAGIHWMASC